MDMPVDVAFGNLPVVLEPSDAFSDACAWTLSRTATAQSDRACTGQESVTNGWGWACTHAWCIFAGWHSPIAGALTAKINLCAYIVPSETLIMRSG